VENFEQSASPSYLRPSYLLLSTIHLPRVNVSTNHHSKYRRRVLLMSRGKKRSSAHQCCYGSLVFGSQGRWHPRTGMAKDPIRCARRQGWRGGVVGPLAFLSVLQPHARQPRRARDLAHEGVQAASGRGRRSWRSPFQGLRAATMGQTTTTARSSTGGR